MVVVVVTADVRAWLQQILAIADCDGGHINPDVIQRPAARSVMSAQKTVDRP